MVIPVTCQNAPWFGGVRLRRPASRTGLWFLPVAIVAALLGACGHAGMHMVAFAEHVGVRSSSSSSSSSKRLDQPSKNSFEIPEARTIVDYRAMLEQNGPVVAFFTSPTSDACLLAEPLLKDMAAKLAPSVHFFRVQPAGRGSQGALLTLSRELGVRSLPTFVVYLRGEIIDRVTGASSVQPGGALWQTLQRSK
mmetsp:Transcript_112936/g.218843  ORF Transcript_112936/g.218843 Transcript_112936/m.218843 type:complete len:194 (-) Transcript_112936:69-650(-)